jgi:hypothetical protein
MGMNRTFKAAVAALVLAVSFAGSVAVGPLEDGAVAYEKGDYATAGLWELSQPTWITPGSPPSGVGSLERLIRFCPSIFAF